MRTNQSFRKPWVRLLLLLPMLAVATLAPAQTLNWGNAVFDYPMDSKGNTLDSSYVFQLGAFKGTFAPDDTNIGEWLNNWQVFDQADYNPLLGYFTSDVQMTPDGLSNSAYLSPGATSFENKAAYLWIRNFDTPSASTEWLLVRASSWVFPVAEQACCANSLPVEWAVSDLTNEIPEFGAQGDDIGPGDYTVADPSFTLQTHNLIPEPGPAVFALLGALALLRRRRV